MIKSFACKETERIFSRASSRKLPVDMQSIALRKLLMLHAVIYIQELRIPPSNKLEKLSGNRRGQYSIRINKQWRICFVWQNNAAYKVEIVDYH